MDQVLFYLTWGFEHIISADGLDHILFIMALTLPFQAKAWKKVIILVTAFTIGHAITLVISVSGWLVYNSALIELLVPVTILITAVSNIWRVWQHTGQSGLRLNYFYALIFGLVHGLAYSANIKFSLADPDQSILMPLLAFNIGLEAGQIIVVALTLLFGLILKTIPKLTTNTWSVMGSVVICLLATRMIIQAEFWSQL